MSIHGVSAERMARLEAELAVLREAGSAAATDRVLELESSLDDVTRLKESLEAVRCGAPAPTPTCNLER
jgi:hypothetical protein